MIGMTASRIALVLALGFGLSACNKAEFECASQDAEKALIEAARVDGASYYQIFWSRRN